MKKYIEPIDFKKDYLYKIEYVSPDRADVYRWSFVGLKKSTHLRESLRFKRLQTIQAPEDHPTREDYEPSDDFYYTQGFTVTEMGHRDENPAYFL